MFTDMVGYAALSQRDETYALLLLEDHRKLVRPFFPKHSGHEIKTIGDAFLVEFDSALEAVRCAFEIQQSLHELNSGRPFEKRVTIRVGVHLGDVVHSEDDVYGDAVNIASRIEPLAEPGGVCVTGQVYDQVKNKFEFPFSSLGRKQLKNVGDAIEVFKAVLPWEEKLRSSTVDVRRIAVMPFANMSRDPGDEYFADGMTEELISSISNIGGLSVISRTSVMKFKGERRTASEIGQELKAGTLLEGSVRKSGEIVRVTAQLIDVNTDRHLWSQNYDRELRNIFAIQSEIAKNVADSVRVKIIPPELSRIERKPTENTTAYTLYLKGRHLWNKRGSEDLKKAAGFFERAIGEDPSHAPSYVGLADCFLVLRTNWGVDLDPNHEKAKTLLSKALAMDPGLAEAQATMGLLLEDEYHLRQAEEKYRKAIDLKPGYIFAHMWYSNLLINQVRFDEALEQVREAMDLDPLSPFVNMKHAFYYLARREYGKALELCKRVVELDPNYSPAHATMGLICGKMKLFEDSKRYNETAIAEMQDSFPLVRKNLETWTGYFENDKNTVEKLLPQLQEHLQETLTTNYEIGCFYFYLGQTDKAFEWLERSFSNKEYNLLQIQVDPFIDEMPRNDTRYGDILKRLELRD